jgi:hypothetical protein
LAGVEELVHAEARVDIDDPIDLGVDDLFLLGVVMLQQDEEMAARRAQYVLVDIFHEAMIERVQQRPHLCVLAEHHQDRAEHAGMAERREEQLLLGVDVAAELVDGSLQRRLLLDARGRAVGAAPKGVVDLAVFLLQGSAQRHLRCQTG